MLKSRNVFIDTQSFVKAGLHFENPAFKSFRKYCKSNELNHISTSVVYREVISKIEQSTKEAIIAIQTFRRKARLISSLADEKIKGFFEEISEEDVCKKSIDVFNEFMTGCSTEIVEANSIDVEELLSLYFDKKPPFGEGKKKSEFPDAISILSLKSHLKDCESVYVISEDNDLKNFCANNPSFILVESLDKLLDIYTNHTNTRHAQVKKYFIENELVIKNGITKFLQESEVYNSSSWYDSEVDDGLIVTNLGEIKPSILYIDDEESQITFDINVDFEVTVSGPDFNNSIYDKEDGRVYTFATTSITNTISRIFTVELFLHYEFIDGKIVNANFDGLYIADAAKGIEVSIEENDFD